MQVELIILILDLVLGLYQSCAESDGYNALKQASKCFTGRREKNKGTHTMHINIYLQAHLNESGGVSYRSDLTGFNRFFNFLFILWTRQKTYRLDHSFLITVPCCRRLLSSTFPTQLVSVFTVLCQNGCCDIGQLLWRLQVDPVAHVPLCTKTHWTVHTCW